MEMDDRASAALHFDQHKNHIAALMISNAKSLVAASNGGYNVDSSITGVNNNHHNDHDHDSNNNNNNNTNNNTNNNNGDALGSSSRSRGSSRSSNKSVDDENENDNENDSKTNGEGGSSGGGGGAMNTGRWSADEHKRFLAGLDQFGTGNWKKITDMVGTRSCTQIRTHAQKYFIALQKPMNDPSSETGGYARKKSKMLIGADHHLSSNIKTGSSAIITGYGGGGTPIHPSGILPVTGTMGVSGGGGGDNSNNINSNMNNASIKNNNGNGGGGGTGQMIKQFWGPDGLRDNNTGLTGMEVLAQAAITGEKQQQHRLGLLSSVSEDVHAMSGMSGIHNHAHYNQYESSLDKAVAELRKKIASDADAAASAKNAGGHHGQHGHQHQQHGQHGHQQLQQLQLQHQHQQQQQQQQHSNAPQPSVPSSASEVLKEVAENEANAHKRKLEDAHTAAVVSSYEEQHKKMKHSDYAAAVQDTIDRKDVLEKLQAVAERQEFLRLRQEVKNLNQTIIQLQQQSIESDNRVMEAITDRRVTLNECKNLQEINAQLKTELRRMVMLFEHNGGHNNHNNSSALMAAATQGANVELMQARLTESELRYHTVTESLSRQTGVLTDQHRAILALNTQLEQERANRQTVEFELKQMKKSRM